MSIIINGVTFEPEADLSGVQLSYADLSGASLRNADLFDVYLSYANLYEADLTGATVDEAVYYQLSAEQQSVFFV